MSMSLHPASGNENSGHLPVMVREIVEGLNLENGDIILDGTLGGGGHAKEIIKRIWPSGKLIALDKDAEAIKRSREKLAEYAGAIFYFNEDFRSLRAVLESLKIDKINGALFDIGMSSYQVDDQTRGFSFLNEGPLDMRFDLKQPLTAREVVNSLGKEELADVIYNYGEERYSRIIASGICSYRKNKKIATTKELAEIIKSAVGGKYRGQKLNPAARTFQALRIYVNDELGSLKEALETVVPFLAENARLCVISFHSLEDRIVKNHFRGLAKDGLARIITKKPLVPSEEEVKINARSRSAKLRIMEKA